MRNKQKRTAKKLTRAIILAVILAICLCITTYALVLARVSVKENRFQTGVVDIALLNEDLVDMEKNDQPLIEETEFLFEPGMTVKKDFFIENRSTCKVYYKLYFDEVSGGLADVLEITIQKGDKILYRGTAASLNRANVAAADDVLGSTGASARRQLTILFHYPEAGDNSGQNQTLSFKLCADAVQTKNNDNKEFK